MKKTASWKFAPFRKWKCNHLVDVITDIKVSAPLGLVAAYASNPDNAPEWYVNIKSAVWHTPKPLTVRSSIAFIVHFLGKELSYTYEVIELSAYNTLYERTNNPVVALNRCVVLGEVAGYEKAI